MAPSKNNVATAGSGGLSRSTTILMGAVSGHHIFHVKGYSQTKEIGNGEYMTLGAFDVGGRSWSVQFYPNGIRYDDEDYISLFLSCDNNLCMSGMPARFRFSVLSPDGKQVLSFCRTSKIHCFNKSSWGFQQFMTRKEFEKSRWLKDDSFTIRCDVFVAAAETTEEDSLLDQPPPAVFPPKSDLQKDLANLLKSAHGTDVTIDVGGEMFYAHQWLLGGRSAVFQDKFLSLMETKTAAHMQINDMEPKVFESLLHYMYTDSLPDHDEDALLGMAEGLILAAERYKLEGLKKICEEMLCKRVDLNTVEANLVLAEHQHCPALKAKCMEFLTSRKNLKAVIAKGGFEILKKNCPNVLFDLIMKHLA